MPCFSSIKTKMTEGARIAEALSALGYAFETSPNFVTGEKNGNRIEFSRYGGAYSASGDTSELAGISKKYAEIGVRQWAKTRGYSIEQKGDQLMLTNRRG